MFQHKNSLYERWRQKLKLVDSNINLASKVYFSNGCLELLKWLALILMTLDHYNRFIHNNTLPMLSELGRVAMPLFSAVFAYNLAREKVSLNFNKIMTRLVLIGLLATLPYTFLASTHYLLPLNILFTLAASLLVIKLLESTRYFLALSAFCLCGFLVEFNWPGIALTVSFWYVFSQKLNSRYAITLLMLSLLSVCIINANAWALFVIVILLLTAYRNINFYRFKWAFYAYYPIHLLFLLLIKISN